LQTLQAVTSWQLGPNGLLYDREWALVDPDGRTLSQRRHPKLTQIRPLVDPAAGARRHVSTMYGAAHSVVMHGWSSSRSLIDIDMCRHQFWGASSHL